MRMLIEIIEKLRGVFGPDSFTTSEFRDGIGGWFRHRKDVQAHILTRSKLIEMAVNVTNLVLQAALKVYSNTGEWEAVARRELGVFRRRPLVLPAESTPKGGG